MNILKWMFVVSCFSITLSTESYQKQIYRGTFKFSSEYKLPVSKLPIYYKGAIYYASSDKDSNIATFEILDKTLSAIFILIIEQPPLLTDTTVEHLKLPAKSNFKLYKFRKITSLKPTDNTIVYSWRIEDVSADYTNKDIPDGTIVIITNPNNIEKLESIAWHKESASIPLPIIFFKDTMTQQELEELLLKMQIALMDVKLFHNLPPVTQKLVDNKYVVSTPLSKSEFL